MTDLFAMLEAAALSRALRASTWLYPLINAAHVLGVALLVGAIVPLDLRLLGLWRDVRLAPLWRILTTMAMAGMAIAVVFGLLLFVARATEYLESGFFLVKMAVFAAGCINAVMLRGAAARSAWLSGDAPVTAQARIAAIVSLSAWTTVLVLGRLVGYF